MYISKEIRKVIILKNFCLRGADNDEDNCRACNGNKLITFVGSLIRELFHFSLYMYNFFSSNFPRTKTTIDKLNNHNEFQQFFAITQLR